MSDKEKRGQRNKTKQARRTQLESKYKRKPKTRLEGTLLQVSLPEFKGPSPARQWTKGCETLRAEVMCMFPLGLRGRGRRRTEQGGPRRRDGAPSEGGGAERLRFEAWAR